MMETLPAVNGDVMPHNLQPQEVEVLEQVMLGGDLAKLSNEQRMTYYFALCRSLKLNPMSRPFEYLNLQGKLTLYARKDCAEQLRRLHQVSIIELRSEISGDLCIVTATARMPNGRTDMDQGAVTITGLRGEALANAQMKALTKSKRRVTLSLCGLGILDETEVDSIPGARPVRVDETTGEILEPAAPALSPQQPRAVTYEPGTVAEPTPENGGMLCSNPSCGKPLTKGQYEVSLRAYGRPLCPADQKVEASKS